MSRLALFLLGPPRRERDRVLISVDTRKAIALLAYLAVTHQRHSRDVLASLLWPEYDQANARSALRRTLSTLNKALAGDWLDIDRGTISFDTRSSTNVWLDVDHFYTCLPGAGCTATRPPRYVLLVCPLSLRQSRCIAMISWLASVCVIARTLMIGSSLRRIACATI